MYLRKTVLIEIFIMGKKRQSPNLVVLSVRFYRRVSRRMAGTLMSYNLVKSKFGCSFRPFLQARVSTIYNLNANEL